MVQQPQDAVPAPDGSAEPSFEQRLGRLLRLMRISRGLTLESAAELCGRFGATQLGRWELAASSLPVDVLDSLARVYKVQTARLIEEASLQSGT